MRGQAYTFAKGILEDAGFAWRVTGAVQGFPSNRVAGQSPPAGSKVVDTGTPTIVLTLVRDERYTESGEPDDEAPFDGTAVVFVTDSRRPAKAAEAAPAPKREADPKAETKRRKTVHRRTPTVRTPSPNAQRLAPDFRVPGVPRQPVSEMPLPRRARLLLKWIDSRPAPTSGNVHHWLYQHAWVVTGANFGWWHGARALRILVKVDRHAYAIWGIGRRSESLARRALVQVKAKSR